MGQILQTILDSHTSHTLNWNSTTSHRFPSAWDMLMLCPPSISTPATLPRYKEEEEREKEEAASNDVCVNAKKRDKMLMLC